MKKISILVIASLMFCTALMFAQLSNPKFAGEIEITPAHPNIKSNIAFKIRVLVKNAPAVGLRINGYIDGNFTFGKNTSGTTPAGYDEYLTFHWSNPTAGTHTISFDIDPYNVIEEENETDNHLEKTFTVSPNYYSVADNTTNVASPIKPKFVANTKPVNIYVEPKINRGLIIHGTTETWNIWGQVKSEFHDLDELTVEIKAASSTANCKKRVTVKDLKAGVYKIAGVECQLPQGMYITVITADPDNLLKEKDRSDNVRIRNLSLEYVQ